MSPNTLEPVTQVSTFAVEILDFLRLKQSGLSVAQNKAEQICTFMTQVQQQVQDLTRKNEDLERQVIAKDRELDVYYESLPTLQAKLHGAEQATSELRVLYKHVDAERLRYIEQCGRVDGFNMVLRKEDDDLRKQLYQLDMQPTTPRDLVTSGLIPSKGKLLFVSSQLSILTWIEHARISKRHLESRPYTWSFCHEHLPKSASRIGKTQDQGPSSISSTHRRPPSRATVKSRKHAY